MQNAGVKACALHVRGRRHGSVIGAEGYHVVAATNFAIEMGKEFGEVAIEGNQDVLNFAAARTEVVTNPIDCGITDSQEICSSALAETQRVDRSFGETRQVVVGVGAAEPLIVKFGVGFG